MTTPHQPQPGPPVEPAKIHAEVGELLSGLSGTIPHRARVLEEAHEVLVRALSAVDTPAAGQA